MFPLDDLVFIGLGSNLNQPSLQIDMAIESLQKHANIRQLRSSKKVQSKPLVGGPPQPNYINQVCCFETDLSSLELFRLIQKIEEQQGRTREIHWGPRTIDLDILLFKNEVSNEGQLLLPHPGIAKRDFVLVPLLELAPDLIDPQSHIPYQKMLEKLLTKQNLSITYLHENCR